MVPALYYRPYKTPQHREIKYLHVLEQRTASDLKTY
jgi:hypothetical protein